MALIPYAGKETTVDTKSRKPDFGAHGHRARTNSKLTVAVRWEHWQLDAINSEAERLGVPFAQVARDLVTEALDARRRRG